MGECEKLRGAAEVMLQLEIWELRRACEMEAPNKRMVANRMASLDIAQYHLTHANFGMKMNAQLDDDRYTQYMDALLDAAEEVKAVAEVVTRTVDEDGLPIPQLDGESLK